MKKTTRWVCALALGLALYGPIAKADDGSSVWGRFFEALMAQIEQILLGEGEPTGDSLMGGPHTPDPELGVLLPPGG